VVAKVRGIQGIKSLCKAKGCNNVKGHGSEGEIQVGELFLLFVIAKTVYKFVNLDVRMSSKDIKGRVELRTCFCISPSNLRIARREKRFPRAKRLLCASWKSISPKTEEPDPKQL